jgi:hypothetical protein
MPSHRESPQDASCMMAMSLPKTLSATAKCIFLESVSSDYLPPAGCVAWRSPSCGAEQSRVPATQPPAVNQRRQHWQPRRPRSGQQLKQKQPLAPLLRRRMSSLRGWVLAGRQSSALQPSGRRLLQCSGKMVDGPVYLVHPRSCTDPADSAPACLCNLLGASPCCCSCCNLSRTFFVILTGRWRCSHCRSRRPRYCQHRRPR